MLHPISAGAKEQEDRDHTICFKNGRQILSAKAASLSAFDAARHKVTLEAAIAVPKKNAVVYLYSPTDIFVW